MVFCVGEIEALQLLGWCQYMRPAALRQLLSESELSNLLTMGLIKRHGKSGAMTLTAEGRSLLAGKVVIPKTPKTYHADGILRRLRLSQLLLTAYRAGLPIYAQSAEDLAEKDGLFLTSVNRGRGRNPWGSTRTAALLRLGKLLCAAHFVCTDIGNLCPMDELTAFQNNTAQLHGERCFLFFGERYEDILAELDNKASQGEHKLMGYGGAFRWLQQPIFLLPCDDTGAVQLQIMAQIDYRQRLTRLALKGHYRPPPENVTCWDALFQGQPFVLAADMDIRRIEMAYALARERGYEQIALAALPQQAEEVWDSQYRDTGKARVFTLTDDSIAQLLGASPKPYRPPANSYVTEKGDMIHAPIIKAAGKVGRHR